MLVIFEKYLDICHGKRWANVFIVMLRIMIGFAFVPAGLKKILYQPFTDPENSGRFHDFLHAFYDTGFFYQFVGLLQLLAAILLCTQRFATIGVMIFLPICSAITVFCWSTSVIPTAVVATLMLGGLLLLALWDYHKWSGLLFRSPRPKPKANDRSTVISIPIWEKCGAAILIFYFSVCLITGEVYRPRGVEANDIRFYIFPTMLLFPLIAYYLDRRKVRQRHT